MKAYTPEDSSLARVREREMGVATPESEALFKEGRLVLARVRKGKRARFGPKAEIKAAFCNTGVVEVCATEREVGVVRPETWLEKWAVAPEKTGRGTSGRTAPKGRERRARRRERRTERTEREWKRKKEQLHKKNKQGGREKR